MEWLKKQIRRVTDKYTLNKEFTKDYYLSILTVLKKDHRFIRFTDDGPGILLRHDIDKDLNKAVRMAEIEAGINDDLNAALFNHGATRLVHSTFFFLNTRTARYWGSHEMTDAILYIQSLGHEVGWHNNAITEFLETKKDIRSCILEPIEYLRSMGAVINGSSAHGDRLCKKYRYLNYNVFGLPSPGWDFWKGDIIFPMSDFRLEYEAYHVPFDGYLADGHYGWKTTPPWDLWETGGRYQMIVHPMNWRI